MLIPDDKLNQQVQDIAEQKHRLRHDCRSIRDGLGEAIRKQVSLTICSELETWPDFQNSSIILTYMPMRNEVDLTPLIHRQPQKHWVLPRIIPREHHQMVFHQYESTRLVRHPFGMDEPAPDLPAVPCSDIQLALVPGLAFDRSGRRLGYGGGYFDRFLCDFSGTTAGICYHALLRDHLPCCEYDIPVQWVVTEEGMIFTGNNF